MASNAPSVEDLSRAGGVAFAAWHYRHGYSEPDTEAAVRRRWPAATFRTVRTIALRGQLASASADDLTSQGPQFRLLARDFPGPVTSANNFRFVGRLELVNASGQTIGFHPFDLQYQANLDQDAVAAAAYAQYLAEGELVDQRTNRYRAVARAGRGDVTIDSVERQY